MRLSITCFYNFHLAFSIFIWLFQFSFGFCCRVPHDCRRKLRHAAPSETVSRRARQRRAWRATKLIFSKRRNMVTLTLSATSSCSMPLAFAKEIRQSNAPYPPPLPSCLSLSPAAIVRRIFFQSPLLQQLTPLPKSPKTPKPQNLLYNRNFNTINPSIFPRNPTLKP